MQRSTVEKYSILMYFLHLYFLSDVRCGAHPTALAGTAEHRPGKPDANGNWADDVPLEKRATPLGYVRQVSA